MFAVIVCEKLCWPPFGWLDVFCLAIMGIWTAGRYAAQQHSLRVYNAMAEAWRGPMLRLVYLGMLSGMVAFDVVSRKPLSLVGDALFITWNSLACIYIRDREPKDFFEARRPVGEAA
ncbi:hypothetical protein [Bradyrhizobium sp. CCBAU 51753]|uniref:hypothetical protein n=1 Tax=Bradyrhizobium sp. CCBAU 51753 TaxID=1325100 RepID=UPI00188D18C8|nr:hypothetical protein [Bradyrhizobium sp. CCBAU 51753]QOZ25323.1 hypothetical protein XH93_18280 [Bradyrhizobium sp. CCBAU 51753]